MTETEVCLLIVLSYSLLLAIIIAVHDLLKSKIEISNEIEERPSSINPSEEELSGVFDRAVPDTWVRSTPVVNPYDKKDDFKEDIDA